MDEVNKGGYPVKNAGYWRRQVILAGQECAEAEKACAELMELNDVLNDELADLISLNNKYVDIIAELEGRLPA